MTRIVPAQKRCAVEVVFRWYQCQQSCTLCNVVHHHCRVLRITEITKITLINRNNLLITKITLTSTEITSKSMN